MGKTTSWEKQTKGVINKSNNNNNNTVITTVH